MPTPGTTRPPLEPAALRRSLAGTRWRLEVVGTSSSTNADVAARVRGGTAEEGLVLVAEHQTAGRGRLDRTWVTPPRSALTMSVLLVPDAVPAARWPWLPLLTGVAVVRGIHRATGLRAGLKWPNDVLLDGRKAAGILVERVDGPTGAAAVLGVGLNVSMTEEELAGLGGAVPATSLTLAGAAEDRAALLLAVLEALAEEYDVWREEAGAGSPRLRTSYLAACDTIDRQVRVDLPDRSAITGKAIGIDEGGRLEVQTADGVRALGAGDVVHVRPDSGDAGAR